jgi:hypothetical protein
MPGKSRPTQNTQKHCLAADIITQLVSLADHSFRNSGHGLAAKKPSGALLTITIILLKIGILKNLILRNR